MLVPLLARLDTLLHTQRPAYHAQLNPPATAADFAAFAATTGRPLPPLLQQWFGWHNGQRPSCSENLTENYMFVPLDEMAETQRINQELLDAGEFVPNWWRRDWWPLLHNGGGDHLCLDLEGTFTGRAGQMLTHWHDWEVRTVVFPSFVAWLKALVAAYEAGASEAPTDLTLPAGFPQRFEAG